MSSSITCKQAVDYISKKEEKKLSPAQRFYLWKHLSSCSLCQIFSTQNKLIAQAFKHTGNSVASLSDEQKQAIFKAVLNKEKG